MEVPLKDLLGAFIYSIPLDLSMIGYLIMVPGLFFLLAESYQPVRFLRSISNAVTYFFLVIFSLVSAGEACLYSQWQAKLNTQALFHFVHPAEVFKTASPVIIIWFLLLSLLPLIISVLVYRKHITLIFNKDRFHSNWKQVFLIIPFLVISIFLIRGGFRIIPIQASDAYFSRYPVVNDASVNPLWNLADDFLEYWKLGSENPYNHMPLREAENLVKSQFSYRPQNSLNILTTNRPNIVFIILESWSANCVKFCGGENYSPFLDSLSKSGIAFSNAFPSGYVSDQGIPAVLSGYPAISRISIINQSGKSKKIGCLSDDLAGIGYETGFLFGGDLNYGNIKSYLFNHKFTVIRGEDDFPKSIPRCRLGIPDGYMVPEIINLLNKGRQPFFYSWFTVSSHMPYDIPVRKKLLVHTENEYVNSIEYSDASLGDFFRRASTEPWFKNTLFVIVADHSHQSQKNLSVFDPSYHRIPLLFCGTVIKKPFRGKKIDFTVSQLDLAATLLTQLQLQSKLKSYPYSRDFFSGTYLPSAFYSHFSGQGFITDSAGLCVDNGSGNLVYSSFKSPVYAESFKKLAWAFQQAVFEDYRNK